MDEETIETGVAVVAALARYDPSVADVVDTLEGELGDTDLIHTVLRRAEAEGVIEREGSTITRGAPPAGTPQPAVIATVDGEFSCRRCGRAITTGYVLRLEATEVGPYGSTCIRKVTGRD